jgi:hypothetical protein
MPNINLSTESLETLLTTYVNAHETLSTTTSQMSSTLDGTDWHSPAADAFRNAWHDTYYPNLSKLLVAVDGFNADIRNQLARYNANEGIG